MIIILTLDDNNATQVMGRRQSSDRNLAQKIRDMAQNTPVYMKEKSLSFFKFDSIPNNVHIFDSYSEIPADGICFCEEVPPAEIMNAATELWVFRWNRKYISMTQDRVVLDGFSASSTEDFPGHSHHKITLEVYTK